MFPGCAGIPSFDYSSKLFLTLLFLLLAAALFAVACVARLCVRRARRTHRTEQAEHAEQTGTAAPGNLSKRGGGLDGPDQRADGGRAAAAHDQAGGLGRADSAGGDSLGDSLGGSLGDPGSGLVPVSSPSPPPSLRLRFRRLRATAEWTDFAHRLQHCLLILGCIFFLRLTLLFFRGFRCVVAADPLVSTASDAAATQSLYLEEDLQTECWAGAHLQTMAVVLLLLAVYTAGLPAACFVMLMRSFADENTKGTLGWLWARFAVLRGPHCAAAAGTGTGSSSKKRVASWGGIIGGGTITGGSATAAPGKGVTVAVRADSGLSAAAGSDFRPAAALSPTANAHPPLDSPSAAGRGSAARAAAALTVSPRAGHRARLSSGGWSAVGAAAAGELIYVSAAGAAAEAEATGAHSSESFSRAAAESVGPAGKYLRGAAGPHPGLASAAAGAHPISSSLLSSSSSRFGYLFHSLRLSHFAFGLATFALHVWVAAVTVFVSDADPLLKLFLFGLAWAALTVATAVQLPYASLHDNARKVAIGMATLAHSAVLLAAQSGGATSAYLFLLLALFVMLVLALLFRRQIPLWAADCLGRSSPWRVRPVSSGGDDGPEEPQPAEDAETAEVADPASPAAAAAVVAGSAAAPHAAPSAPAAEPSAERRGEFEKSAGKAASASSSSRGGSRIAADQSAPPRARARPGSVSQSQSRSRSGRSEPQLRSSPAQAQPSPARPIVASDPEQGGALPGAVPEADGPTRAAACPSPSPSSSRSGSAAHSGRGSATVAPVVIGVAGAPLSTVSSLSPTPRLLALRPSALSALAASAGRPLDQVAPDDSLPLLPPLLATPPSLHGRAHEEPDDARAPAVAAAPAPIPSPLVSPASARSSSQSSSEVEVHGDAAVATAISAGPSRRLQPLQRGQPLQLRLPATIRDAQTALAANVNEAASLEPADAAAVASAQPHQPQRRIQLPLLAKPSRIKQLTQLPPLKDGQQIGAL